MAISITCPKCSVSLRVPDEAPGRKVRCAQCQTVFVVPVPEPQAAGPTRPVAPGEPAAPAGGSGRPPGQGEPIRLASDYRVGEKVVLTLPLRTTAGEIPAGVAATVLERPNDPKDAWLRLGFVGYERVGESLKTTAYKVESLDCPSGQRFVAGHSHGAIPLRRAPEGWYLPEGGNPVLRAKLRDGHTLVAAVYERTTLVSNFNLVTDVHLGKRASDESGATRWNGKRYQADDIAELVWLIHEPIPEEIPETGPRESWQRFARNVKIAAGKDEKQPRPNLRFQFVFKDKSDADRVLGMLPSEFLSALRRGECWHRAVEADGRYRIAWQQVQMSIGQGKDLLNRVVDAGGEIFEAVLG